METSRADTASSHTTILGLSAIARQMAMRCRCPPEKSAGMRPASLAGRPTVSSSSCTRRSIRRRLPKRLMRSGSPMMLPIDSRGLRDVCGSWNTTCTFGM